MSPNESTNALIHINNLTKKYRTQTAIDDFSVTLKAGRIIGLMGANGCGKTSLLKILAGVLADWEGTVDICGAPPGVATKAHVAFLPTADFLDPKLTPASAIDLYQRFFADFDARKAHDMVTFFDLPKDRQLKEMSKGMGEKLQIALVMSRKARIYLLDEPISGVDPAARDLILNGILKDFNEDALMLISTHLIADVETIVDEVIFMKDGRLLLHENADDLRQERSMTLDGIFRKEYR